MQAKIYTIQRKQVALRKACVLQLQVSVMTTGLDVSRFPKTVLKNGYSVCIW